MDTPSHGTSGNQLERWCRANRVPHFEGVFCSSNKPQLGEQARLIFNYSACDAPGTHWLGFIKEGRRGWWFDSLGQPPGNAIEQELLHGDPLFKEWILTQVDSFVFNPIIIESLVGASCGQYACYALKHGTPQMNPAAWTWVTNDRAANDATVIALTKMR
jgi:hypothetical protein